MADAINKQNLIDQINALTLDGEFSQTDVNYLMNWIIANGDTTGTPRDLIQIRRGNFSDLPNLAQGELGFTLDTNQFFVGGMVGNVDILSPVIDKVDHTYGASAIDYAKADSSDETAKIQAMLNKHAGKRIVFPYGKAYKVNGLIIPENTTIYGYGAKLYNSVSGNVIAGVGSGVKIYGLEIQGQGNGLYVDSERGINIQGVYNQYVPSISYVENILIEDCHIHGCGGYGIYLKYAKDVKIIRNKIKNVAYAGIMALSSQNIKVDLSHISDITPGSGGLAYGVAFTRAGAVTDLIQHPRSIDCSVENSLIENITLWEALDTHGGKNIHFMNNTIKNCRVGIACVGATADGGVIRYGVQECSVIGNTIYGIGNGYGIVIQGAALDYANACVVQGNSLTNCGQQSNNISGAIFIQITKGIVISGNTLNECYSIGIVLYNENRRFTITGNNIKDIQDATYVLASCIAVRSSGNDGTISGNTLTRDNIALNTYVSKTGLLFSTLVDVDIVVGHNSNNCESLVYNGIGQSIKYSTYGDGMHDYVGAGSPEGVIVAKVGSRYTETTGTGGKTLYIKESGSGNTGWSAVRGGYINSISATPAYIGQEALVGGVWYKASGIVSTADWKALN